MARPKQRRQKDHPALLALCAVLACSGLASSGLACSGSARPPEKPAAASGDAAKKRGKTAAAALAAGEYSLALSQSEKELQQGLKGAVLLRRQVLFLVGRYDEAAEPLAAEPLQQAAAASDQERASLLLLRARAHRLRGRLEEALRLLPENLSEKAGPEEFEQLLLRAEILFEQGKTEPGTKLAQQLIERANHPTPAFSEPLTGARLWTTVGRAAHLLRSPKDANEAYNNAEELGPASQELLLSRADLFLEKFDVAQAVEALTDAQKLSPHHPEVLLLEARIALEELHDFVEAEALARRVLSFHPKSARAHGILAASRLRDFELEAADREIEAGKLENPRDLRLLAYQASVRFLAEDRAGFQAAVDESLSLNPKSTEVFRVVADFAEWEHRYPDIEKLMRRAVRLDRDDGRARAILGLTLVRSASDAAGVVELRRAFELDPFNLRVKNTLDLYEGPLKEDYVDVRHGVFDIRYPRAERALLERYVPPLLEQAYAEMKERYGFTPASPIGIEIYESRQQFAVRTSGLPRTGIHGVCFGRKLATMSPIAAQGNLGMTLWHELAHVFHIGLSDHRVPRYLTEGLAEWETAQRNFGWAREMDENLVRALRTDSLPELGSMNRAFTHARVQDDIATAYYASSKIAEWLMAKYGQEKTVRLLAELGRPRLPNEVLPDVLGTSLQELDKQFRLATEERLKSFSNSYIKPVERLSLEELSAAYKKEPKDPRWAARLGRAYLARGNKKSAKEILEPRKGSEFQVDVAMARVELFLADGRTKYALSELRRILEAGVDGPDLRLGLARLLLSENQSEEALTHAQKADEQDPHREETVSLLASLFLKLNRPDEELAAVKRWAELSEHDPFPHRRLLNLLLERGDAGAAALAAERALWVDLASVEMHRLSGLAFSRAGDFTRGEFEFESALLCPSDVPARHELLATWQAELLRRGQKGRAEALQKRFDALPVERPLAPSESVR